MKVWVITEFQGYGLGEQVVAVRASADDVTAFFAAKCGKEYGDKGAACGKRHDQWCSYGVAPSLPDGADYISSERMAGLRKDYQMWAYKFCSLHQRQYSIQEMDTTDG